MQLTIDARNVLLGSPSYHIIGKKSQTDSSCDRNYAPLYDH